MINDPIKLGGEARWLELAALGRDAWNIWADSEIKKPKAQRVTVELGGVEIVHTNWSGFKFPGAVHFNNATFPGGAHFGNAEFFALAWFAGSRFAKASSATFLDAKFLDRADFSGCVFCGLAFFNNAQFGSGVSFNGACFEGFAHFYDAIFKDAVDFCRVRFDGNAGFGCTTFSSDARFLNTRFGSTAIFEEANFDGVTRFDGAEFAQPPDLRTTNVKHGPSFLDTIFGFHSAPEAHVLYRRLKKFAIDAHDHRSEMNLFALETKARRGHHLKWTRPRDWLELFLSHLYEIASDYGRSLLRPLIALALTFLVAAWQFARLAGQSSAPWRWTEPVWVAAFVNLLPFAGQSVIGRQLMEIGICPQVNAVSDPYCLTRLYGVGAIEGMFAVAFLFLLVLGLRNLFRIK